MSYLSLHASVSSNANSIIHDNEAEAEADRKEGIGDAVADGDGGGEGGAEGGVGRGHSPGREQEPQIPFPLHEEIQKDLHGLRYQPRQQPRHEGGVGCQRGNEGTYPKLRVCGHAEQGHTQASVVSTGLQSTNLYSCWGCEVCEREGDAIIEWSECGC